MSDDYGTFPKKWVKIMEKLVDDTFKSKAESSSSEELANTIVNCAKTITNTEKDMTADEDLKNQKEELKYACAVYSDVIKGHEAMKRYCVYLLESMGTLAEKEESDTES